jgi:hypothetical protein
MIREILPVSSQLFSFNLSGAMSIDVRLSDQVDDNSLGLEKRVSCLHIVHWQAISRDSSDECERIRHHKSIQRLKDVDKWVRWFGALTKSLACLGFHAKSLSKLPDHY